MGENLCEPDYAQKNPHVQNTNYVYKHVDNVDNHEKYKS